MKKFITLALALILVLTTTVCVFAADFNAAGSDSADVQGKYVYNPAGTSVKFTIEWQIPEWTYTTNQIWNDQTYTTSESHTWNYGTSTVTVTNKSNVGITVAITDAPVDGGDVNISFDKDTETLAAAANGVAPSFTATVNGVTGSIDNATAETIATITVNVSLS